jgi:DNA polymerase alpha subunit B
MGIRIPELIPQSPPSALNQSTAGELLDYQHGDKLRGEPLSMMVAAGPYTLDDDLLYQPLSALIDVAIILVSLAPPAATDTSSVHLSTRIILW